MRYKTPEAAPLAVQLRDAANKLNISMSTLRRRIRSGQVAAVRIGTRLLIRNSEIERVLHEGAE